MDLTSKVAAQPGAEPIEDLPDAWHWSRMIFNFDAILSPDHQHLLEMRVMGRYDASLARTVLAFARTHSDRITQSGKPLIVLDGFTCPGWKFDTVAAVAPSVHDNHAQDDADLHQATWTLFPGYGCEFSGTETQDEAVHMFSRALQPTKLDREPSPFLRMRYDNTRTRSHSIGPDRGLAPLSVLLHELSLLNNAPGSWVEWENRHGDIHKATAETPTTLTLHNTTGEHPITTKDLLTLAEDSIVRADHSS
ncbi:MULTISPECIES: hypothetical protein [unclassified Streptomyces]|uniref:hypothetical protein n=1 Tax=unclassified Streptomyces TaxID=2593676 RepID=UPI00278BF51F|nr:MULTISPECIES: hypothetical protein [unclassified Streptomyces]